MHSSNPVLLPYPNPVTMSPRILLSLLVPLLLTVLTLASPSPQLVDTVAKPATAPSWTLSTRQSSENGVNIIAGSTGSATAYGSEVHIISDTELGTFGLAGDDLKAAVGAYAGREPNDAFVRSPTPWDDLYTKYSWPQVTTTIRPVSAEVIDQSVEPVIVAEVPFNNTSSQTATFDASANQEVRNTVSTSWSNSGSFTFTQTVNYEVEFQGTGGGVETSFGFSRGWGESGEESQTIVVGLRSGASVELEPGEAVYATIRASRGAMKVRVTYLATVGGFVACNYNPTHNDHHFWAYDVNGVLRAQELPTERLITQEIEVGYFFDSYVETSDVSRIR